ncbi:MAG: MoaD/ThiS family protein [Desulfurococcales archaeon]|nr:MoaD/ThiS family protein [Desulfurococcales archaeon]
MIRVTVRVYATLIGEVGWRVRTITLRDDATVRDALDAVGLSRIVLLNGGVRPMYKVLVNGRDIEFAGGLSATIRDSDTIDVFPPVAGGYPVK